MTFNEKQNIVFAVIGRVQTNVLGRGVAWTSYLVIYELSFELDDIFKACRVDQ